MLSARKSNPTARVVHHRARTCRDLFVPCGDGDVGHLERWAEGTRHRRRPRRLTAHTRSALAMTLARERHQSIRCYRRLVSLLVTAAVLGSATEVSNRQGAVDPRWTCDVPTAMRASVCDTMSVIRRRTDRSVVTDREGNVMFEQAPASSDDRKLGTGAIATSAAGAALIIFVLRTGRMSLSTSYGSASRGRCGCTPS